MHPLMGRVQVLLKLCPFAENVFIVSGPREPSRVTLHQGKLSSCAA